MYHRYENLRFETWTKITKSVLLTYRFKSWAHNAWIQYPLSEFEVADNLHVSFWFGWRPVRYHPTSDVGNGNCYWVSCHTGWPNRWIRTGQAMCAGRPYNVPSACTELARPPGAWAKPIIIIINSKFSGFRFVLTKTENFDFILFELDINVLYTF